MSIRKLVIASHNEGKVREIGALLAPLGIDVVSAASLGLPEPEETGDTFEANARLKAEAAAEAANLPALSDDSGLVIPSLDGQPGIYSARWAGPEKDFAVAMRKIQMLLREKNLPQTGAEAAFVCVLSLAIPGTKTQSFAGEIRGALTFPPKGDHGFGYDPIFIPEGRDQTFAELDAGIKNQMSHRARAFEKFVRFLQAETV